MGGSGEEEMGSFLDPGETVLTDAWRKDYLGKDDYFAIVTGASMSIGNINGNDPLGIASNQLTVKLAMPSTNTMSYGGANVSGLREKVLIEVIGGNTTPIPDNKKAAEYIEQGSIAIT